MKDMKSKWIMGCTESGPIAGKVMESISPQYIGQKVSHRVSWIEGYEGWLDEGHYVEFDHDIWNYILVVWNRVLTAKAEIENILGFSLKY